MEHISFIFLLFIALRHYPLINPSNFHILGELVILFLEDLLLTNGGRANQHYLPLFFLIFMALFLSNLGGMIPYNFTLTAQLFITLFFSFFCFFGINYLAVERHKLNFFSFFLPPGTPFNLIPLLVFIEVLSYFSRLLSLAIRLFANMMAGHTLLKILSIFLFAAAKAGGIFFIINIIPMIILQIIIALELAIAAIQVYVFLVLFAIYLKDVYLSH